jgi:type IV secretory pathway ATPase VirB11/archaellum biosynthesis ATPase
MISVPPPEPPDSSAAWYAPHIHAQYTLITGTVVTIANRFDDIGFSYQIREPLLSPAGKTGYARIESYLTPVEPRRPLTREGAATRAQDGLSPKYQRALDSLLDVAPAVRRQIEHYTLRDFHLLGPITPLALDPHIVMVDADTHTDDTLIVHTDDYAPAFTQFSAEAASVTAIASERLQYYTVGFAGFDIEVVIRRDRLLGDDRFKAQYAVLEPPLLPGDSTLIRECKEYIWNVNVETIVENRAEYVYRCATAFLSRRLMARNTTALVASTRHRIQHLLSRYDILPPPVNDRFARERLDDLIYYVLRDYVGEGVLTIPIRDPYLEDIEANRVGERIKIVPRADVVDVGDRLPTNLQFENETSFVNIVTQLAANDGVELSATQPSAKVNLRPAGGSESDETIRCAVALPVISEDGPHVSIRKQATTPLTPVDLIRFGSIPPELVALLWLLYEYHRVVLFSGPTGVGKTTLLNSHMPFIPFDNRPISIDEGSREVYLPHETGVSLTTRDHEDPYKRVSMADLMVEANYLNPDVEVIAEVNSSASFQTFGEILNTGHGVIGTTHAEDIETLVNRVVEQGLPVYLLREIDIVVFPQRVAGERFVGSVVELVSQSEFEALPAEQTGVIQKANTTLYYNTVFTRHANGEFSMAYDHPSLGGANAATDGTSSHVDHRVFHALASATNRSVATVEAEFRSRVRYVRYLVNEDISDADRLFSFLSDLRTDEAATVDRVRREQAQHSAGG